MRTYSIKEAGRIINYVGSNVAVKSAWFPPADMRSKKCRFSADDIRQWIADMSPQVVSQ